MNRVQHMELWPFLVGPWGDDAPIFWERKAKVAKFRTH